MPGKLKALGLAVIAALALSAVIATSASAWFTWEEMGKKDPPDATGSTVGLQIFYNEEEELSCEEFSFDGGTVFGGYITANPEYGECTLTGEGFSLPAHVDPTECDFEFHTDWAMGVECPEEEEIHVSVTFLGSEFDCLTIPSQTQGGPEEKTVTYTNEGSGTASDVKIEIEVEGIEYTKQGICGEKTFENGGYKGEITVKGDERETTEPIGIEWDEH